MYVKQDGRVFPCCQSYMLDGAPVGDLRDNPLDEIFNSDEMRACAVCTPRVAPARSICARDAAPWSRIRCWWPAAWCCTANGCAARCPVVERLVYGAKLPKRLLAPAARGIWSRFQKQ